jgi:hypothetical protein
LRHVNSSFVAETANFSCVLFRQPWYMLTNITAGPKSTTRPSKGPWDNSHFDPTSSLFRPDEFWAIAASDVGILTCLAAAYLAAQDLGWYTVFWAYFLPVMWVNHFIGRLGSHAA